ncbi:B2 bradykinin receptor-like [Chaetodon trifascialis]|uniref:B2 bradykinin receptor-like n=1 Tax=Chaetodon trifascialis TaxID=109706 RepID=UPI0039964E3D
MTPQPTSVPANNTNCSETPYKEWIITVVPIYILLITALGIVFNVFVLVVFWFHKKPCTVAEIYLSNLAAADLVLVSCLPFWAVNVSNNFRWPFGQFLCKVVSLGISMNAYCSIYFLVLVSIDRYVALVHAMSFGRMRSSKDAKLGCVMVWGLGLLLSIPTLIYREVKTECNTCSISSQNASVYKLFQGLLTMFIFIIPISVISYCTVKIIQALNNRLQERSNKRRRERKATSLVLAVVLAFLICWLPYHLFGIVDMLENPNQPSVNPAVLGICLQIFTYLAFFNSVLNPILYVIIGDNFRKKVKELSTQWSSGVTFSMVSLRSNTSTTTVRR